jgi:hypothetical protein
VRFCLSDLTDLTNPCFNHPFLSFLSSYHQTKHQTQTQNTKKTNRYDHVGRTCLISFSDDGDLRVFIEGETPGVCPLRAVDRGGAADIEEAKADREKKRQSLLKALSGDTDLGQILSGPLSQATFRNGSSASIGDMLKLASNYTNLNAMMQEPPVGRWGKMSLGADLKEMGAKLGEAVKGVTDTSKVGEGEGGKRGREQPCSVLDLRMGWTDLAVARFRRPEFQRYIPHHTHPIHQHTPGEKHGALHHRAKREFCRRGAQADGVDREGRRLQRSSRGPVFQRH